MRHGGEVVGGWYAYKQSNRSILRWVDGCCIGPHYVEREVAGRAVLAPCKCLGQRDWRRHKMQRRLGMGEK
jgi:hypothetical protein